MCGRAEIQKFVQYIQMNFLDFTLYFLSSIQVPTAAVASFLELFEFLISLSMAERMSTLSQRSVASVWNDRTKIQINTYFLLQLDGESTVFDATGREMVYSPRYLNIAKYRNT